MTMIERTIEKIAKAEKKTERDLEHLEKRWNLKLKAEKAMNIQRLKDYRKDINQKMNIQKEEKARMVDKEIRKMEKETENQLKYVEKTCEEKRKELLKIIVDDLKD